METLLDLHISIKWPRRPKPVTSVAAFTLCSCMRLAASLFNVFIDLIAVFSTSISTCPFLRAVDIMPVPIGLVRIKTSPEFAPELRINLSSLTRPFTIKPYFGSLSSIE